MECLDPMKILLERIPGIYRKVQIKTSEQLFPPRRCAAQNYAFAFKFHIRLFPSEFLLI